MSGSLYINHINSIEVEPQLIYGTPKLAYPYKDATNEYMDFPKAKWYYLAEKWNGTNILFYKYYDSKGQMFISAKTKGTATLKNSEYGAFLSLTLEALGTTVPWGEVPDQLMPLMYDSYQSMSFELCGKKEPHLVKYDFDIKLKPLFYTREYGGLVPYLDPLNTTMPVPFHYNYSDYVGSCCRSSQERDLAANEEYRKANSLPHKYEFEHFAVEGKVLYLLDENGNCIDRTLYKIKSKDIEEVHWQTFNAQMQDKVAEAVKKLGRDELEANEANLAEELDMGPKEWNKWGRDIMRFASSNPADNKKELLVLVGVPGSGKSTFAKQLEPLGWVRVNQDDLGSRNKCKELVVKSFKENKKVVIDRCNFDVNQRKAWLDLAKDYNCKAVSAIVFDTPHAVCKDRVVNRQGHPTIAPVEGSKAIIDKFASIFVDIKPEEGFGKTTYVNTEEMVKNLLGTYGASTK
jgi:predicted kinase